MQIIQNLKNKGFQVEIYSTTLLSNKEIANEIANEIDVGFIDNEDVFLKNFTINFFKLDDEDESLYQKRLNHLMHERIIPGFNKETSQKHIFFVDPKSVAINEYFDSIPTMLYEDVYNSVLLGKSDSKEVLHYEEDDEDMPTFILKLMKTCYDQKANDINLTTTQNSCDITLKKNGEWSQIIAKLQLVQKNTFIRALCAMSRTKPNYKSGIEMSFGLNTTYFNTNMNFRVSIMPSAFGENISLRKIVSLGTISKIENLGFSKDALSIFKRDIDAINGARRGGLILVTGETGSGKTTLLGSIIQEFSHLQKKICVSEDPIEILHSSSFVNQTQVGEQEGLTHLDALKGFLRQNPDVIVVGEIRDAETMRTAIDAALRGHYVLSTLHTASVQKTFKVVDGMGVDMQLFNAAIKSIYAVTLVSKLCDNCKIRHNETDFTRNIDGCDKCSGGLSGVVPAGEIAKFDGVDDDEKSKVHLHHHNYSSLFESLAILVRDGKIDYKSLTVNGVNNGK